MTRKKGRAKLCSPHLTTITVGRLKCGLTSGQMCHILYKISANNHEDSQRKAQFPLSGQKHYYGTQNSCPNKYTAGNSREQAQKVNGR